MSCLSVEISGKSIAPTNIPLGPPKSGKNARHLSELPSSSKSNGAVTLIPNFSQASRHVVDARSNIALLTVGINVNKGVTHWGG